MADFQDLSDSEEEVFFGPITEREKRRIALLSQRKDVESPDHNLDSAIKNRQSGEEGLHTLAMAAQMLSISSGQKDHMKEEEESCLGTEIKQEKEQIESNDVTSSKGVQLIYVGDYTNDGSHLELDAVKFLAQRLPENQNNSGGFIETSRYVEKNSCETGDLHHTSFASSVDDSHDEIGCLDNGLDIPQDYSNQHLMNPDCLSVGLNVLEANVKMEDLPMDMCNSNVDIANINSKEVKIDDISRSNHLTNMKFSNIDWQDANEISRSDFGIKMSDNEEEIEKVERNLKVEEIIKFLADEEVKTESETGISSECCPNNDLSPTKSSNITECHPSVELPYMKCNLLKVDTLNVCNEDILDSSKKETDNLQITKCKEEFGVTAFIGNSCSQTEVNSLVEPKQLHISETETQLKLKKLELNLDQKIKTEKGKELPGNIVGISFENQKEKRLRTPNKVHLKPIQRGTNVMKCSQPRQYPPSPAVGMDVKRKQGVTPRKSPSGANQSDHRSIPLLQRDCGKNGTQFKTPNSKLKPATMTKIPHLSYPVTPSPRKNNKFAGIVSPVAQYIHGAPVLLISNNKAVGQNVNSCSKPVSSNKPTGSMFEGRGAENVDVNNVPCLSLPANVNYKSALPVKIFSPSPSKYQNAGPTAMVSKHLGHMKMSSLKNRGDPLTSLTSQCRESIPGAEVSILLSKEVGLSSPMSQK